MVSSKSNAVPPHQIAEVAERFFTALAELCASETFRPMIEYLSTCKGSGGKSVGCLMSSMRRLSRQFCLWFNCL